MRVEHGQQSENKSIIAFIQQNGGAQQGAKISRFSEAVKTEHGKKAGTESINVKDATYLNPAKAEEKNVLEEMEESTVMTAEERKNQMAVLAGTTSEEDLAKMQEDGFSLDSTSSNTIVTVTDKIKAELAKAGKDISGFGDALSMEELVQITGSVQLAQQIADAVKEADLPVTEENVQQITEAVHMADALLPPSDGAVKYLADRGMKPTVCNLYMAQYSGIAGSASVPVDTSSFLPQIDEVIRQAGLDVNEETRNVSKWMIENEIPLEKDTLSYVYDLKHTALSTDAADVIKSAVQALGEGGRGIDAVLLPGYTMMDAAEHAAEVVQTATDQDVAYVVDAGMPLTIESLDAAENQRMAAAQTGKNPAAAQTGKNPAAAQTGEPAAAQTGEAAAAPEIETAAGNVLSVSDSELTALSARRRLEELRLVMTVEANYSLLKRGVAIDTKPLEELVEQLRGLEDSYYRNLLAAEQVDDGEENVSLFREVTETVYELRSVPSYILGMEDTDLTIQTAHKEGTALRAALGRADQRYDTLMRALRTELSTPKPGSFQNVDEILNDFSMETTEENRRAVRILGYNELPVSQEAILQMKAADEEVQRVFKNMTPAVVTQMIKRGINPLEMHFEEINRIAEEIKGTQNGGEEAARYSEYLWKLEQKKDITPQERDAYIGIYRLLHQVDQTDGAAIGALVHQGADLTMKNLLMAVRSEKRSQKMEYTVDDEFDGAVRSGEDHSSITAQIQAGYQKNCVRDILDDITPERVKETTERFGDWQDMTPEQFKNALEQVETDESGTERAYAKEQLAQLQEAARASQDIYDMLQKYDIPNTSVNVMAMEEMQKDRNQMFRKLFGKTALGDEISADDSVGTDTLEQIKQDLLEEFGEAVSAPEDMARAQEKLGELAENVMKTMIGSNQVTSVDLREMRLLCAQLSISKQMAKEEKYSVPVMVNDEMLNVSVKIVRGVDKKGVVDIMMESELRGKIAATFRAKEDGIYGFMTSDNRETATMFEEQKQQICDVLSDEKDPVKELYCAYASDLDLNHFAEHTSKERAEEQPDAGNTPVQTARLYRIAEKFLKMVKQTS